LKVNAEYSQELEQLKLREESRKFEKNEKQILWLRDKNAMLVEKAESADKLSIERA
jgi:hypothetical protein